MFLIAFACSMVLNTMNRPERTSKEAKEKLFEENLKTGS